MHLVTDPPSTAQLFLGKREQAIALPAGNPPMNPDYMQPLAMPNVIVDMKNLSIYSPQNAFSKLAC